MFFFNRSGAKRDFKEGRPNSSKWKGVNHQYGVNHLKTTDDPIEGFETMVRDFDLNPCAWKS